MRDDAIELVECKKDRISDLYYCAWLLRCSRMVLK